MNDLGMMIDMSHVGEQTFQDVFVTNQLQRLIALFMIFVHIQKP
jgi:microsomal dipeptidase-like Zn-dependent dipeptidase